MGTLENYIGDGREYDWFACDITGKIAAFSNAGISAIPDAVVQHSEIIEEVVNPLYDYIFEHLPPRGEVLLGPNPTKNDLESFGQKMLQNLIWEVTSKGLYTYDADRRAGGKIYYPPFIPSAPLVIDELPERLQSKLSKFRVDCDFSETTEFTENQVRSFFEPNA